jgi:hypothetical protein
VRWAPKYACRITVRCRQRRSGAPDWSAKPWQVFRPGFGFASKNGEAWPIAELHRVQGNLLAAQGKAEPARASYKRGVEAARRSGSLAFEQRLLILAGGTAASASIERS